MRLVIEGERFVHLFKARRHRQGESLTFRNLQDDWRFCYQITQIDRRRAELTQIEAIEDPAPPAGVPHLAWCVVDPKTIERTLPMLNELGVGRLSLIWCAKSQRNFRLDADRMARIVIASCEQCGRSRPMAIEMLEYDRLIAGYEVVRLDFGGGSLHSLALGDRVLLIGPEGGFGEEAQTLPAFGLGPAHVLRSETAIVSAAAKLLGA